MKKIFFYASIACILAVSSCKDDEKPTYPGTPGAIQGANANVCPATTVNLSIGAIQHAISYQWYNGTTKISGATLTTYTVTASGTYTVAGVNVAGEGPKSAGHVVTITVCPTLPGPAGTIQGATANTCPAETVALSIGAVTGATSYQWYRNATAISGATVTTYTVTESGTYTVAGVNAVGTGPVSPAHVVTITTPCETPPGPAGNITGANANVCPDVTVALSIGAITGATSYQWYRNTAAISGATGMNYTVTQSGTYTVAGVNSGGTGTPSPNHVVTITSCGGDGLLFTDIPAGSFTATGVPSYFSGTLTGPTNWSSTFSPKTGTGGDQYYEIGRWAPAAGSGNNIRVYVDYIPTSATDGELWIDNQTVVAMTAGTTHVGYWDAFVIEPGTGIVDILDDFQAAYDKLTNTMDFSGTYDGNPVMLLVGAWATSNNAFAGGFSEGYVDAQLVITPSSRGAVAGFTATPGIKMTYNAETGLYELPSNFKIGKRIKFDPAKFSRK